MNRKLILLTASVALHWSVANAQAVSTSAGASKPNIIVIITDDMGFSDIGPYGGEIKTPNLDKLAAGGVKFSQFYNCAKCEPSRAALVTGHQWWTHNPNVAIRKDSPNIGEVIRTAGYRTMMVGKWHCDGVPFERGFDRHFGFMGGGTDFLHRRQIVHARWQIRGRCRKKDFYVTTALTDHAVKFIREEKQAHPEQPFFLYLAYNAPHCADSGAGGRGREVSRQVSEGLGRDAARTFRETAGARTGRAGLELRRTPRESSRVGFARCEGEGLRGPAHGHLRGDGGLRGPGRGPRDADAR